MTKETIFSKMPPYMNLLLLTGLVIAGLILSAVITLVMSLAYTHGNMEALSSLALGMGDSSDVRFMKFIQLINQLFMFVAPALVFALLLKRKEAWAYMGMKAGLDLKLFLLCILMFVFSMPLLEWTVAINEKMVLPQAFSDIEQWMKSAEVEATVITEAFLNTSTYKGLLFNLLVMALIPALGEELIFRASVQKMLVQWFKKPHVAVIITAIFFSAVHLQFYGFLPRLLLGLLLGYVYFFTGNLWYAIALHFINNAFTVCIYFIAGRGVINADTLEGQMSGSMVMVCVSALLFALAFSLFIKQKNRLLIKQ